MSPTHRPVTQRVPAVLHWTNDRDERRHDIYHADLFLGGSPAEIVVQFEHPEANQPTMTWLVPRELFTLIREVQLGSSGTVGNFAGLTFGPQCKREHGWTQIGPLHSPLSLALWDPAIDEFFTKLTRIVPGSSVTQGVQIWTQP